MVILYSVLLGAVIGVIIPVIAVFVSYCFNKHKLNTTSGVAPLAMLVTVPAFAGIGLLVGIVYYVISYA